MDGWMLGVGPAVSSAVSECSIHGKLLDVFPLIPVVFFDMKHSLAGKHECSACSLLKFQTVTVTVIWRHHM